MNRETLMKQIESKTGRPATEIDATLELVLQEIGRTLIPASRARVILTVSPRGFAFNLLHQGFTVHDRSIS